MKILGVVLVLLAVVWPTAAQPQQASASDPPAPLLTLDDAVSFALQNNRLVKNSVLEGQKYDFRVKTSRSWRLPQFQFAVLGGALLHSFDFTFPAGAFGNYPGAGPIPAADSKIRTPAQFTTYTTASLDQPLTQQYRIHLGIRAMELGRESASEDVRAQRQRIVSEVRKAYFSLVATQARVDAARYAVNALGEAQQVTVQHQPVRAVLRVDALEV